MAESATQATGTRPAGQRRVALVTGGTRGIGAAITERLARDGIHVAAVYVHDDGRAKEFLDQVSNAGMSVSLHRGDIGSPADCARLACDVVAAHGPVDYLVNNAAISSDAPAHEMTVEQWDAVVRVSLSGVFYLTRTVLPTMLERGFGRIVNVGSIAGTMGSTWQANYAAAKGGVIAFTKSIARETSRRGVTANCVLPGPTRTDMAAATPDEVNDKLLRLIPARRVGRPEEIAHAVRFLLDDLSGFITGALLPVDGGMSM